jgi:hypothetical protein
LSFRLPHIRHRGSANMRSDTPLSYCQDGKSLSGSSSSPLDAVVGSHVKQVDIGHMSEGDKALVLTLAIKVRHTTFHKAARISLVVSGGSPL